MDAPASLISQFDDWMHEDSVSFQMHFNMLFTVYSFPNIFIPLFGGSLVSRYGDWQMLIVFAICMMVGEFIFGTYVNIRGLGLHAYEICQLSIIASMISYKLFVHLITLSLVTV